MNNVTNYFRVKNITLIKLKTIKLTHNAFPQCVIGMSIIWAACTYPGKHPKMLCTLGVSPQSSYNYTHSSSTVSFREIQCSSGDPPVPVTTSTSIASWNTGHSPGDATSRCSYQLHVLSGQRWKLTLLDFTNASPRKTDTKPSLDNEISAKRDVPTCMKYARIQVNVHIKLGHLDAIALLRFQYYFCRIFRH